MIHIRSEPKICNERMSEKLANDFWQKDIDDPDLERFPLFDGVPKWEVEELGPGEMLYMPAKMWHHVTATSPSFSVSFWWTWCPPR